MMNERWWWWLAAVGVVGGKESIVRENRHQHAKRVKGVGGGGRAGGKEG